jgi:hypothetical protein
MKITLDTGLIPKKTNGEIEFEALKNIERLHQNYEYNIIIKRNFPNSLIGMLYYAYVNHLPIKIRPDDLWIQILCQFSLHVNQNSDKLMYKKFFADKNNMDGKTELQVIHDVASIKDAPIYDFINKIIEQLDEKMNYPDVIKKFQCDFTTSNVITGFTTKIIFMYMIEKYFSYKWIFGCGIPYIELDGTLDDWLKFQTKIKHIFELFGIADETIKSWCNGLINIAAKILDTINDPTNTENIKFLKNIFYEERCGSGSQMSAKGWITNLFLYDKSMKLFNHHMSDTIFWDDYSECIIKCPITVVNVYNPSESGKYEILSGMHGFYIKSDILQLNMGFYMQRQQFIGWTFNEEDTQPNKIIFNKENYNLIKYNNKLMHEHYLEYIKNLPVRNDKKLPNFKDLEIYYGNKNEIITFAFHGNDNLVQYTKGSFANGKFKFLESSLSNSTYVLNNTIKIYPL